MDDDVYEAIGRTSWPAVMGVLCSASPVVAVGLDIVRAASRRERGVPRQFQDAVAMSTDDALRAGDVLLAAAVELGAGAQRSAYDEVIRRAIVDDGLTPWVLAKSIDMILAIRRHYIFRSFVEPLHRLGDALRLWGDADGGAPAYLRWDYPLWADRFGLGGGA